MNSYLIGLEVGGTMECPTLTIQDIEVIQAETRQDAINHYNEKNDCHYFYATCLAEKVNDVVCIINRKISYSWVDKL